ncbi:MAG: AI-2E family transporter [Candidatus Pacebacteria bacterium]|jgi:predicted PurR-regulated permease PerM|nr:AI-2E family transporter [Candidatus Paceibacterota bacterium]|tara:strand:- start:11104 stop:12189 length:1086 start_codon:yes stop_codon:yes gene_type:complete
MEHLKNMNITISSGTIIKGILLVLLIAALFFLKDLVLIVMTAIVIASAIEPITKWFVSYRIPRIAAVLLVYIIIVLSLLSIFYFFVPPLLDEASNFLAFLPKYTNLFDFSGTFDGSFLSNPESVVQSFSLRETLSGIQSSFTNMSEGFVKSISVIFGGALSFILIIVFSFYFAVQETGIDDFLRIVTPVKQQNYILDLWKRSQLKIGRWMQGQLILALIVGVLVYIGLTVLDVRYALLLAVLAGIFELIPLFGAILAAIPGVLIAFVDGGVALGFLVIGLYLIIQQFENHLIYPLVVTKVVGVPPLLVILALIIGAQFAGFLGVILSVPIAAIVQEFVKDIQKEKETFLKKHPQKRKLGHG